MAKKYGEIKTQVRQLIFEVRRLNNVFAIEDNLGILADRLVEEFSLHHVARSKNGIIVSSEDKTRKIFISIGNFGCQFDYFDGDDTVFRNYMQRLYDLVDEMHPIKDIIRIGFKTTTFTSIKGFSFDKVREIIMGDVSLLSSSLGEDVAIVDFGITDYDAKINGLNAKISYGPIRGKQDFLKMIETDCPAYLEKLPNQAGFALMQDMYNKDDAGGLRFSIDEYIEATEKTLSAITATIAEYGTE